MWCRRCRMPAFNGSFFSMAMAAISPPWRRHSGKSMRNALCSPNPDRLELALKSWFDLPGIRKLLAEIYPSGPRVSRHAIGNRDYPARIPAHREARCIEPANGSLRAASATRTIFAGVILMAARALTPALPTRMTVQNSLRRQHRRWLRKWRDPARGDPDQDGFWLDRSEPGCWKPT